jgi:surface polysaccharide O-acyltransferase-like enzyme
MTKVSEGWCTYLRVLAMVMVVALHSSGPWLSHTPIASLNWELANAIESATRISVPLFFMLSGYLLSKGDALPWIVYFRKRLMRIAPAFIAATIFAVAFNAMTDGGPPGPSVLWQWLIEPQYYHLWFFYALVIVYLLLWVARPPQIEPIPAALCCLALIIISGGWLKHYTVGYVIHAEEFLTYYLFALGGHYLGQVPRSKKIGIICMIVAIALATFVYFRTSSLSLEQGHVVQRYYDYFSIPVECASFAFFYGFRSLVGDARAPSWVNAISIASLSVYCWHPFLISTVLYNVPDYTQRVFSVIGIAGFVVASLVTITALSWAMSAAATAVAASVTCQAKRAARRPPLFSSPQPSAVGPQPLPVALSKSAPALHEASPVT